VYNLNAVPTSHTARLVQPAEVDHSSIACILHLYRRAKLPQVGWCSASYPLTRSFPSCDIRCVGFLLKCAHGSQSISLFCSEVSSSVYAIQLGLCWMAFHLSQSQYRFQARPPSPESPTVEPRLTGASADRCSMPLSDGYSATDV